MMMLNVPATVGLMVLAAPIVRLLFERRDVHRSRYGSNRAALQFYALGLLGYSVVRIASPTFYALGTQPDAGHVSAAPCSSTPR